MPFDFASVKATVSRVVHSTFGVAALYQDVALNAPVEIRARWHSKIERFGDLDNQQYAELIQGVDRVIFNAADARVIPVKRGGTVTFACYGNAVFNLQIQEEVSTVLEEIWQVTRA